MKKCILFTLIVLVPLFSGCGWIPIQGSGNVVTQDFDITGFDKVDVSHAFTVDITQGDTFSVVVSIDDNVVDYLQVEKSGSTLKIGLAPNRDYVPTHATAEVTIPELAGLEMSGGSRGTITGFESTKGLSIDLSGGSSLEGDIEAGDSVVDLSGGSDLSLTGSGQDLTVEAEGASQVDLAGFPVADANVGARGASTVTVNASGTLNGEASGRSHVYYLGSPTLGTIEESSGSSVEPV